MIVSITSIELKSPFKFFALSLKAMYIVRQLKATDCKDFKKTGIWTKHYTMTLWNSEAEMMNFVRSDAHLEAMKESAKIAKEIWFVKFDAEVLPNWEEAKRLISSNQARVMQY